MSYNKVDYAGKKVVVTGGASGMGEAVVKLISDLGAEVYLLDIREGVLPVKQFIPINLAKKDSIDSAVAALPDGIDAVFHAAGVAGKIYKGGSFTNVEVATINFVGLRYCIEGIVKKMNKGSAISLVSSIAGFMYGQHIADYADFVKIDCFDEGVKWLTDHEDILESDVDPNRAYTVAKECVCIYAMYRSWGLAEKGIRINAICPGGTVTPMHDDFNEIVGQERGAAMPVSPIGREAAPEEMASVMLFLNCDMATYVSGQIICVDAGLSPSWVFAGLTDHVRTD